MALLFTYGKEDGAEDLMRRENMNKERMLGIEEIENTRHLISSQIVID